VDRLDILVAEKVMGWKLLNCDDGKPAQSDADYEDAMNNDGWAWDGSQGYAWKWHPSTDIRDSIRVLELLGCQYDLRVIPGMADRCVLTSFGLNPRVLADRHAQNLPLAICLAALEAKGIEVSENDYTQADHS
jgi:hypothetical protein